LCSPSEGKVGVFHIKGGQKVGRKYDVIFHLKKVGCVPMLEKPIFTGFLHFFV
jgi:hypothetical protein